MSLRLIITINAAPGKGAELAAIYKARSPEIIKEPGCIQFEVFQSTLDPDRLVLMELWRDEASLQAHAELNKSRASLPLGVQLKGGVREDYVYKNR